MTVHATEAQLAAYLQQPAPADAARLLERASEAIDDHVLAAYTTDSNGVATDDDVLAALADATCAQVEFWMSGDEEDDILGPPGDTTIGPLRVEQTYSAHIAPRAVRALRRAGLGSRGMSVA